MLLEATVEEYLKSKNLEVFRAGSGQLTLQCVWCGETHRKGKLYVNAENGAFDCVSGDTRMVTRKGIFPIAELAGTEVEVLSHQGWIKAPVRSFGIRQTYEVHLRRSKLTKVIRATDGHRWFLKSGKVVRTDELTAGAVLAGNVAQRTVSMGGRAAIARGIMAGDGSVGDDYAMIELWGHKAGLVQFFDPSSTTPITTANGVAGVRINGGIATKADRHELKMPPSMEESDEYLLGWLQGYFAADGTIHGSSIAIDSTSMANLERVQEICDRLGIVTGPIRSYSNARFDGVVSDLPRISFHRASLWPEFFIREDQRKRFGTGSANGGQLRLGWKVEVVLPGRVEEVYCPVVPGAESFTLEHNLLTGNCKICGVRGGFRMLREHFGDEVDDENHAAYKPSRKAAISTEYATLAAAVMANHPAINEYLQERGISPEIIMEAKLGFHAPGASLIEEIPNFGREGGYTRQELRDTGLISESGKEFLTGKITIPYLVNGQVVQVRGKDPKGKYFTPPGDKVRLYNIDALRGAETVLIVEGEFDCLLVQEMLSTSPDARARNIAVVAVPGTQALPGGKDDFAKLFEHCRRVYVGFDPDVAGRRGALVVRDLLGPVARVLEIPEEDVDWTDWLAPKTAQRPHGGHNWVDIMRLIQEADMRDKRVFTVQDAAAQLYELEHSAPGIKTGFASLDAFITPGLRPGSLTIPLARTGVGKSVFIQNMAYNTRHHPSLFISLELMNAEVWTRLRRIARFHNPAMEEHQLQDLYSNLRLVDENAVRADEFDRLIEDFIEDHGESPRIVYVDYLGYYARAQRGNSQYEKMTAAVMSLKEKAKEHRLAIITPGQVSRGNKPGEPISETDARDAGAIEETADFLFGLWRPWEIATTDATSSQGKVQSDLKLNILKSRHGNKGRVINLSMSHHSLTIVDGNLSTLAANRIDQENHAFNQGQSYEEVYLRQREHALKKLQPALPIEKAPFDL